MILLEIISFTFKNHFSLNSLFLVLKEHVVLIKNNTKYKILYQQINKYVDN